MFIALHAASHNVYC